MTTVRLTNTIRANILKQAMVDIFSERTDLLLDQTCKFAYRLYCDKYGDELESIKKLNLQFSWLSNYSSSARIYRLGSKNQLIRVEAHLPDGRYKRFEDITGYVETRLLKGEFRFPNGETLPFPDYSPELHVENKDDGHELDCILTNAATLIGEEVNLRTELHGFLQACKNSNQLESNWPEGMKYLPKREEPKKLPIPLIDNVRRVMK